VYAHTFTLEKMKLSLYCYGQSNI